MLGHLKERENPEGTEPPDDEGENEVEAEAMSAESVKSDKRVVNEPVKLEEDEGIDDLVKERKNSMKKESGSNVKFLKKCHYCPKLFSNRSGRLYHQEQFHFNRRRFECDRCEANFGLKQTLMNHIRNKHSNGVRNFQCDLCSKSYKTKSALHNHRIYHSSEPKYSCNYCEKRFHFNFLLRQHETTHLGIKSGATFDCDVCKKTFNTRNKLTKHRGIHDSTQYSCTKDGCTFTGNLKRYLIAHMKRMHS
jgi:stress-induced morphogen